jgi:hypothetical protein
MSNVEVAMSVAGANRVKIPGRHVGVLTPVPI